MSSQDILEEIKSDVKDLKHEFNCFKLNTSVDLVRIQERMKTSSKLWGVLGGLIPAVGVLIYEVLK